MALKYFFEKSIGKNDIVEYYVNSISSYLMAINDIFKSFNNSVTNSSYPIYAPKLWFRGIKMADQYNLEPTITRKNAVIGGIKQDLNPDYEAIYLAKFKSKAIPYLGKVPYFPNSEDTNSYWGWLFMARHYGVPTRIMDWSQNAFVALLFALYGKSASEKAENSAVWCLNPMKLNEHFNFHKSYTKGYVPNVEEKKVYQLFGPESGDIFRTNKPCAVIGPLNNPNIIAQSGTFTVSPLVKTLMPLNKLPDAAQYLYKIIIVGDACGEGQACDEIILTDLRHYGITNASLFPEISRIIEAINEEGF